MRQGSWPSVDELGTERHLLRTQSPNTGQTAQNMEWIFPSGTFSCPASLRQKSCSSSEHTWSRARTSLACKRLTCSISATHSPLWDLETRLKSAVVSVAHELRQMSSSLSGWHGQLHPSLTRQVCAYPLSGSHLWRRSRLPPSDGRACAQRLEPHTKS